MKQYSPQYLFLSFFIITSFVFSQDSNKNNHSLTINVPEVALISVNSANSSIELNGTHSNEAGDKVNFNVEDSSTWINYSSIVGSIDESNRFITAEISEGEIPKGLNLLINATNDAGKGDGLLGTPNNAYQTLNKKPIKLIEQIGSCYTGVGTEKGHNITYKLMLSDKKNAYKKLDFNQSETILITYTLSDN